MSRVLGRDTRFGRWGGEQFMVIRPGTLLPEAEGVAERVRQAVSAVSYESLGTVTASLGVTQAHAHDTVGTLLKRTNEALYAAKHAGRNQVRVA